MVLVLQNGSNVLLGLHTSKNTKHKVEASGEQAGLQKHIKK